MLEIHFYKYYKENFMDIPISILYVYNMYELIVPI